jgi:hypothetical protein
VASVLYHAATGRPAFDPRPDGYDQLERRAHPVARAGAQLPFDVAAAIDRALDPDPAARPAVDELGDVLDDAIPE